MKRKWIFWLSLLVLLAGIAAAAYSYTGPNRTVTTTYTTNERRVCYWEATHPDVPSGQTCFLRLYYAPSGSCPYLNPSTNQGYFSVTSCMPAWHGLSCPASGGRLCSISGPDTWTEDCSPGQTGCESVQHTTSTTYPPATVSGATACALPGNNGWCRGAAVLNLSGSEPLAGYTITGIESSLGMLCSNSSCTWTFPEGSTTLSYWALSSYGDTSLQASTSMKVDTVPPVLTILPSGGTPGDNGWFTAGPVTAAASATDDTSGVAAVSFDGGGSTFTASEDGIYSLSVVATDNAGNSASGSVELRIDATPPVVEVILPAADGENGWYVGPVTVRASGSDATSGVASVQVSLDGSAWSDELTFSEDGVYTFQARVIDNAGNVTVISRTVQVDQTEPALSAPVLTGTPGLSGWYTSEVEFTSEASDATSGLASLLYSLDGEAWLPGPLTLPDGQHTVQVQATDRAGNVSITLQTVDVDTTPPQSAFVTPADGSTSYAHGNAFVMGGGSLDVTSGVTSAQISLDDGVTWLLLAIATDGSWSYTWDTTGVPNGSHVVLVEAEDMAGNQEHTARITVIVANLGPSVSITDSFWVWQAAQVGFSAGVLPITGARIVVSDGEHSRTYHYSAGSLPSSFQWDGKWEDGAWAGPGSYTVTVSAWDMFGNDGRASASVHVPAPATRTPTPTPTATPTQTASPTATPSGTPLPPAFTPEPPQSPVVEPPVQVPEPPARKVMLWPVFGFVALLAALASASLSDPRPRALRALAKTLDEIQGEPS